MRIFGSTLALVLAVPMAAWPAVADLPSVETFLDNRNVYDALQQLNETCADLTRDARRQFYKDKRQINRSLGSLDRKQGDKAADTIAAQRVFAKRLKEIERECERTRERVIKAYMRRGLPERSGRRRPTRVSPRRTKPATAVKAPKKPRPPVDLSALGKNFEIHGRLSQTAAYRVRAPHAFTQNRSELVLEQRTQLDPFTRFKFSQRASLDTVIRRRNDRFRGEGSYQEDGRESEVVLRDAYVDLSRGDYDFRIGKQQIVWGEAVSLFIADVVNGKDLREFILPDFERIRLPQWSAVGTRTRGAFIQEALISIPVMNKVPTRGSEFSLPLPVPDGIPVTVREPDRPSPGELDVGTRLSYLIGGWDLGAFYLYSWEKTPILFRRLGLFGVDVRPEYRRQHYAGFTFSKDFWFDTIVKSEFLFKPNAYLLTSDPSDGDGVVRRDVYDYVVGVDRNFFESWDVTAQVVHRLIRKADPALIGDRNGRAFLSLWLKRDLFPDKLAVEYTMVVDPDRSDRMHRPRLVYRAHRRFLIISGVDFLDGSNPTGLFSPFDAKDRAYMQAEFHF